MQQIYGVKYYLIAIKFMHSDKEYSVSYMLTQALLFSTIFYHVDTSPSIFYIALS